MAVRSFKGSTSSKRSMDRKTADALKKEKAPRKRLTIGPASKPLLSAVRRSS